MKRHRMPEVKESSPNVTPLIDIVMVLIIFFMLVAKIGVTRGEDQDIALPSAILGKSLESLGPTLTLNVHWARNSDEPTIYAMVGSDKKQLHVRRVTRSGNTDDELARVLDAFQKQYRDKATVIIRADKDMPYWQLEMVLLACAQGKINNVTYETKPAVEVGGQSTVAMAQ